MNNKIKIALVRGDSLNEWEGKLWENLDEKFEVTGFCGKKNLYQTKNLSYHVNSLPCGSDNFLISNLNKYFFGQFQKISGLEKELANFDIAHTAEIFYYYTLQAVRAKKDNPKLKVAVTVWDNSFGRFEFNYWSFFKTPPPFWRKEIYNIIKEVADGADIFLPVSKYSAEMLLDLGVEEKKIKILMPAVAGQLVEEKNIIEELGLNGQEVYLMVNRLVKEKGIYDVLYGWKMFVKKKGSGNKKLVIIGGGEERRNFLRLVDEFGLANSVKYLGSLPNQKVRALYPLVKCLILGSLPTFVWQEQFGYVLAEAITAGCPVVGTYSGAIPEVIETAGLLFAPGNPVSLCDCLIQLNNDLVYQKLKENCKVIKEKFLADSFKFSLAQIYNKLLHD